MGLMARVFALRAAQTQTLPESGPASTVIAEADDHVNNLEVWGPPGLWALPADGTMGIRIPAGGSERWGAIIATQHYKTPRPTLAKGDTAIGSTNATGTTLMARAQFYADGKVSISNATKDILTLTVGLIDLIKAIVIAGGVVNPASQAALEAYKLQYQALFKVPV
jgi:hypothetical protein